MNESVNLTKILKDCPKGTKFYSSIYGDLLYSCMYVSSSASKITFIKPDSISMVGGTPITIDYYSDGRYFPNQGECTIFPSIDQRDWSKFTAPWYKKEKFDPKTLKPFDKVLVKQEDYNDFTWSAALFSHLITIHDNIINIDYLEAVTTRCTSSFCIPYNDDTKHLVGTEEEAPDFYRYWED